MQTRNFQGIFNEFTSDAIGKSVDYFRRGEVIQFSESRQLTAANSMMNKSLPDYRPPKEDLRALVGKVRKYEENIGTHPDFCHLKHGDSEHHYIVSVFADIKGSTRLATKLPLDVVRELKNGSLTAMIEIFQAFDGHIHRLQGDGLLAFFGRKDMRRSQAIIDALNAVSFLQHFFQNNLRPYFEDSGYPPIRIRVGIDFGDDEQVLWARYGIRNCDEVTSTSLHTDLAAKLQGRAPSNGVMIGDNVRAFLDFPDEFYGTKEITRDGSKTADPYVFQFEQTNYRMWQFDWGKYLNRFIFSPTRSDAAVYKAGQHFNFDCYYRENGAWRKYTSNCLSLPKSVDLEFRLSNLNFNYDKISWRVINRGEEAKVADSLDYEMNEMLNKTVCPQFTAYTGHHYMVCTISYQGRVVARERIGLYVNDN